MVTSSHYNDSKETLGGLEANLSKLSTLDVSATVALPLSPTTATRRLQYERGIRSLTAIYLL